VRPLPLLAILSLYTTAALADGLSPMPLSKVLPGADVIVVAEISSNIVTMVRKNPEQGPASVVHTCRIKAAVVEEVTSNAPKELDLTFVFTVVKGVWLGWTGSGLEQQMKPKEKYVFLLASRDGTLRLLRAERATKLKTIRALLKQRQTQEPADPRDTEDGTSEAREEPRRGGAALCVNLRTTKPRTGVARVLLCQSPRAYGDKVPPARRSVVPFRKGRGTVAWQGLPPGQYAIKAYFDANGNGKLDSGLFGHPLEPYGFSNDARGRSGPPSWDAASFAAGAGKSVSVTIDLK
jgi:uncharacterized protein (DUF2141 family)